MQGSENTYLKYLKSLNSDSNTQLQLHETIVKKFQTDGNYVSRFAPVIYVLDYTTKKYLYVDEACFDLFGYTATQWKEEGIEGYLSKWHADDLRIMSHEIFPKNLQFLQDVTPDKYEDLIFSYNYRVLNAKGEFISILQRSSFIPGKEKGHPIATIGAAFEITHFKTDTDIIHTIEEVRFINARPYNEIIYKRIYHASSNNGSVLLSKREIQILQQMALGLSSKQIADQLYLSTNTINNHRKNMLNRTGCKTSVELLKFAIEKGYL
jgi:DNA-binding CsgD family transcriptional regulator